MLNFENDNVLFPGAFARLQSCVVPCKGDCVVTQWSTWSSCFGSCSLENETVIDFGLTVRTRAILQQAGDFGTKCPEDLLQRQRCNSPLCLTFAWKVGPYIETNRLVAFAAS